MHLQIEHVTCSEAGEGLSHLTRPKQTLSKVSCCDTRESTIPNKTGFSDIYFFGAKMIVFVANFCLFIFQFP